MFGDVDEIDGGDYVVLWIGLVCQYFEIGNVVVVQMYQWLQCWLEVVGVQGGLDVIGGDGGYYCGGVFLLVGNVCSFIMLMK